MPSHKPIKAYVNDVSGSNTDPRQDQAQWWPFEANASADWPRVKSPALEPPTKTAKNMIATITLPKMEEIEVSQASSCSREKTAGGNH